TQSAHQSATHRGGSNNRHPSHAPRPPRSASRSPFSTPRLTPSRCKRSAPASSPPCHAAPLPSSFSFTHTTALLPPTAPRPLAGSDPFQGLGIGRTSPWYAVGMFIRFGNAKSLILQDRSNPVGCATFKKNLTRSISTAQWEPCRKKSGSLLFSL